MYTLGLIIEKLHTLEASWDSKYMLFSQSGTLLLVDSSTHEVLDEYTIPSDGGDPGVVTIDGKEYLDMGFTDI